jgi:GTP-binding protein Era
MIKSGFVTIIGRPNAGKSTFLNSVLRIPLSSISKRPQTTRNRITGILNGEDFQIVFLDTPGITERKMELNKILNGSAIGSLEMAEIVLYFVDVYHFKSDADILALLQKCKKDVICVLNKIDKIDKAKILPIIKELSNNDFIKDFIPISALKNIKIDEVTKAILNYLPEGDFYYPQEYISGNSERFIIAEAIKGAIFNFLGDEIPYGCAVYVDQMKEKKNIIVIDATIFVERKSQKGIIIGKEGAMAKRIGTNSRMILERIFQKKFYLNLFVKVKSNWQKDEQFLKMLGYTV